MENVRLVVASDDQAFGDRITALARGSSTLVSMMPLADVHARFRGGHIVILDARVNGAIGLCEALSTNPKTSVLIVGAEDDDVWAQRALEAGARGVLTHGREAQEFAKAIDVVAAGGLWARRRWIDASLIRLAAALRDPASGFETLLSSREREVCRYTVLGFSNKEVATRLEISEATVKVHLTHIFHKLGVQKRGQLAAAYHGFLALSQSPRTR